MCPKKQLERFLDGISLDVSGTARDVAGITCSGIRAIRHSVVMRTWRLGRLLSFGSFCFHVLDSINLSHLVDAMRRWIKDSVWSEMSQKIKEHYIQLLWKQGLRDCYNGRRQRGRVKRHRSEVKAAIQDIVGKAQPFNADGRGPGGDSSCKPNRGEDRQTDQGEGNCVFT